jgi:elongation factor G
VSGIRAVLNDGQYHQVDSSDMAVPAGRHGRLARVLPAREAAGPRAVMKVELEGPQDFHGMIIALIMQRRGSVIGATEEDGFARVEAQVRSARCSVSRRPSARLRKERRSSRWSSPATSAARRAS